MSETATRRTSGAAFSGFAFAGRMTAERPRRLGRLGAVALAGALVAGCQVSELSTAKHLAPVPASLERKIDRMDMRVGSPILLRIFKQESELEVWKEAKDGRYKLLKTYEICAWSGELGPKLKEGDRQAPEGFYRVTPGQMNPNSSYHLAFNIGFPNRFDRSHGRTGSHLMVHGDCSSRGCYAMEDAQIQEIYALAREAFRGGQSAFQVQAFPFRMTPQNMARHAGSEHMPFWEMLKTGSDHFEVTGRAPKVDVCGRGYVFNAEAEGAFSARASCPTYRIPSDIKRLVAQKRDEDLAKRHTMIARAEQADERRKRWEEREATVAAFFDAGRKPEAVENADEDPLTATTAALPSAVPMPRRSPRDGDGGAADDAPRGLRFGLFNRARDDASDTRSAVSSIAGVHTGGQAAAEPAVPSRASAAAAPARIPERAAVSQPAPTAAPAPAEAVAAAPPAEERGGFFSSVTEGGKGLFRRAGRLFN